ncbi:MAG: DinB family protein [Bacteroidetes bacterium]|jgi:uncharacterized damage-inducible protein DinB|nr:DinB family protein [Bacteroidota bacterium]
MRYFLFLVLLFGGFVATAQSTFLAEAAEKWDNAMAYTLELAEAMPEEHYGYKPTKAQMTFQEQLLHMAGNVAWLTHDYLGGEKLEMDTELEGAAKTEVVALLRQAMANAKAALANFPESQLDEDVDFFAGPMSKRKVILLLHDHLTHHRGQLIVYARLKGIKPPRYRGW